MSKYFRKVQDVLKTNKDVKALGFSRKEIKGIASKIDDKLNLEDDATDDDVSDAINEVIDDVLPILKLTQSIVDRQVQNYKSQHTNDDDLDDDPDEDPDEDNEPERKSPSKRNRRGKKDGDGIDPATLKLFEKLTKSVETLSGEVAALKSGNTTNSRRSKVEKMLENTGKFGERELKSFSRMAFDSDEEFEDYIEELQEKIDDENQERANRGLEKLGKVPAAKKTPEKEDEVMSDDEVKKLAKM